ncbi:MAG TPA: hypothetical protein P5555_13055 [Candidatus Paceibacterota bacterium]|nr:hypothetical protein [Verrucomicrobiota bacterium]HOX03190.1 hypothetical protein [Verrucomicrobiota bacterium]HRZ46112.1 hypothetical protein [Candidatus Paceibacterota bacterium]HRZ54078.1 hypothetical protein [Candidatus Paceibacterota bacterium]
MKDCFLNATLSVLGLGLAFLAPPCRAGLPQPMCIIYGQALDGYGLPYRAGADVILFHGTSEIARQTINGSLAPGVNFALYVHLDDGRGAKPYSPRAVRTGDSVSIVVRDKDGVKTIMESQLVPPVGLPGDLLLLNVTAGQDTDGDGLSDLWEWEIIAWSNGALHNLWEVNGDDDFDGDHMSNRQEYQAGTFAFLDYDALLIEELIPAANGRLRLTFLSVPGITYSVRCATGLSESAWQPCAFSLSDAGAFQTVPVEGPGNWMSLYVPLQEPMCFYHLIAE